MIKYYVCSIFGVKLEILGLIKVEVKFSNYIIAVFEVPEKEHEDIREPEKIGTFMSKDCANKFIDDLIYTES